MYWKQAGLPLLKVVLSPNKFIKARLIRQLVNWQICHSSPIDLSPERRPLYYKQPMILYNRLMNIAVYDVAKFSPQDTDRKSVLTSI